jgi:hypothetical protein
VASVGFLPARRGKCVATQVTYSCQPALCSAVASSLWCSRATTTPSSGRGASGSPSTPNLLAEQAAKRQLAHGVVRLIHGGLRPGRRGRASHRLGRGLRLGLRARRQVHHGQLEGQGLIELCRVDALVAALMQQALDGRLDGLGGLGARLRGAPQAGPLQVHLLLQPLHARHELLGVGRAAGDVDVHRDGHVDAGDDRVDVPVEVARRWRRSPWRCTTWARASGPTGV